MDIFKKLIYISSFFAAFNLVSSTLKESNNHDLDFLVDSREFPSEDSDWFVTAIPLDLFPQDDNTSSELNIVQTDSISDEPNISED